MGIHRGHRKWILLAVIENGLASCILDVYWHLKYHRLEGSMIHDNQAGTSAPDNQRYSLAKVLPNHHHRPTDIYADVNKGMTYQSPMASITLSQTASYQGSRTHPCEARLHKKRKRLRFSPQPLLGFT
ncbi:hypothetical protein ACFLW6_04325 [Chloroflexota bacterium]